MRFSSYLLDLDRGCLLRNGGEISLRPKTYAVLLHLVNNEGRLVSKEELFAAVWPNVAVTDDALVQSIAELRRAFGEDGARFIRTVPRRGYRFEAETALADANERPPESIQLSLPATSDAAPSLAAAVVAHTPATPSPGRRVILYAMFAIAALLVAGGWWAGSNLWSREDQVALVASRTTSRPAIAVLPLVHQKGDTAREYFADGLTQDIINGLGRFSELTVMSWNAVFPYKGRPASPGQVARDLAVDYQVEGSVLQIGERVRVTSQLVGADGRVLWSARFDEALADIFILQRKIAAELAGALAIRLTQIEQRKVLAKPTESLEAYDYVLRARPALQGLTRAGNLEARTLLRRAIQIDPNYATGYAALAEAHYNAVSMGWAESPVEFLQRAAEMANRALSLDASEVRAHVVLGRIHIFYRQYEQARMALERAIALNPNDANALAGRGNILMWLGQIDAAIGSLEVAQRVDPELNPIDRFALSLSYYLSRRYEASIEQAQINLRRADGAHFNHVVLAAAYGQLNRPDEAAQVVTTLRQVDPTFDARVFGSKLLNPDNLEDLRDGLRKAGFQTSALVLPLGR
jgi:TolB-like protein/DNA-binding winged helix-turn-helix (wHTH) protein